MAALLWVIGILAAIPISHFYYRRSLNKTLSFFLIHEDQPLSRMDVGVRERLKVQFFSPNPPPQANVAAPLTAQAHEVGALHHLQFLIANTGVRAISFHEGPTLEIPAGKLILDASIIYQKPDELAASLAPLPIIDAGPQKIRFSIPLLNRGEFFIGKLLLSESTNVHELALALVAEDLPRSVSIMPLPRESTMSLYETIEWAAVWFGLFCIALAVGCYFASSAVYVANPFPDLREVGIANYFTHIRPIHLALIGSASATIFLGFIGAILLFSMGLKGLLRRHRIVLPPKFRPGNISNSKKN